jgi:hypothetical protein
MCECVCVYDKAISDKMILCNFFLIVQTDHRLGLFVFVEGRQNIMYHRKAEIIYYRSAGLMGSDSIETDQGTSFSILLAIRFLNQQLR